MTEKIKDIVIVGGSLAGLLHAVVLKELGHNVHILERSAQDVLESQAAGIRAGPDVHTFIQKYVKNYEAYANTVDIIEVVDENGDVVNKFPPAEAAHFTTWSILYGMFKASLLDRTKITSAVYETGKLVEDVRQIEEKMSVTYRDLINQTTSNLTADLVIAADGANSTVRRTLFPELSPQYAGYVTWRGTVPEHEISEKTRAALRDRVVLFRTENGYILSYYVPSDNKSGSADARDFIWVWYQMLPGDSDDFKDAFTDTSGKVHLTTIPRGKMQRKVWEKVSEYGERVLSPPFAELLRNTVDPFVSAIRDCVSPTAVHYDGKLILVGDAMVQCRPHTAISTDQAAQQALSLESVFQGKRSLADWEKESLETAKKNHGFSIAFGEFCFTGKAPDSVRSTVEREK